MKLPIVEGKQIAFTRVTAGTLVTDEYTQIQLSLPGRTDVVTPVWLIVLPATGQWMCNLCLRHIALCKYNVTRISGC